MPRIAYPLARLGLYFECAFDEGRVSNWPGPKLWHQPGPHPLPPQLRAVWVNLDKICIRPNNEPSRVVPDGLDMTGQVRGLLREWHRTARGDWLGVVNFKIPYADGRQHRLLLSNQLVPAYALRPREDEKPI